MLDRAEAEDPHRYRDLAPRAPDGPVELDQLVPGTGAVELDIGFGRGHSLFSRALEVPDRRILGLEVKTKWVCKVADRIRTEQRSHMAVLADDATDLLPRLRPDESLATVFMHFPDPWWKKRHTKRLVMSAPFVSEVARLLVPGGGFFVQTDVPHRAEHYRGLIADCPALELQSSGEEAYLPSSPFSAQSNRERRAAEDGLPVYRMLALRR